MLDLKNQGKTYIEIASKLGCSEWTVKYHLMKCRKKSQLNYENCKKTTDPLYFKHKRFLITGTIESFSLSQLKNKIGNTPICYLTGEPIDLMRPETYSLDHIIPISRGGKSSIENVGLVKLDVNYAKHNLMPNEFIALCHRVASHNPR